MTALDLKAICQRRREWIDRAGFEPAELLPQVAESSACYVTLVDVPALLELVEAQAAQNAELMRQGLEQLEAMSDTQLDRLTLIQGDDPVVVRERMLKAFELMKAQFAAESERDAALLRVVDLENERDGLRDSLAEVLPEFKKATDECYALEKERDALKAEIAELREHTL